MTLNELRDEAFDYAEKQGGHEDFNFGNKLMFVVSELSEALEADRDGKWLKNGLFDDYNKPGVRVVDRNPESMKAEDYKSLVRGNVEEELADAIIRICDLAGYFNIDLEWHVRAKMAYNKTRPFKHGRKYL